MEVSMPTGSLCAERNVIGTALGEKKCQYEQMSLLLRHC